MRLTALALAAALPLAACVGTGPDRTAFVPFLTVMAETEGLPFECSVYDAASDSCEAISTNRVSGEVVDGTTQVLLSAEPQVILSGTARAQITPDGRLCVAPDAYRLDIEGAPDRQAAEFLAGTLEAEIATRGTVCASYFRTEQPGVYRTELRDAAGALLPDGRDVSTFLPDRARLRPPSF